MEVWPVYIPSKARFSLTGRTCTLIESCDIPYNLVVEQQEAHSYKKMYPNAKILTVAGSDLGLPFSRNTTFMWVRQMGHGWFWLIDDDVSAFYKRAGSSNLKTDARTALLGAQEIILSDPDCAQGSLEYQQYAWSAKKDRAMNSYCDVVVAINFQKVGHLKFRSDLPLKADRDFTLKVLQLGYTTVRVQDYSFASPKNGTNKGGHSKTYATPGLEEKCVDRLCELWPGVATKQVKKDGRVDAKINWGIFKPKERRLTSTPF